MEPKPPRGTDQGGVGFPRTDSLVGLPPRPGSVLLLENDRLRVYETALEPGGADEHRVRAETAVYVIDGGRVELDTVEDRPSVSGYWIDAHQREARALVNVGATPYRELAVQLK